MIINIFLFVVNPYIVQNFAFIFMQYILTQDIFS